MQTVSIDLFGPPSSGITEYVSSVFEVSDEYFPGLADSSTTHVWHLRKLALLLARLCPSDSPGSRSFAERAPTDRIRALVIRMDRLEDALYRESVGRMVEKIPDHIPLKVLGIVPPHDDPVSTHHRLLRFCRQPPCFKDSQIRPPFSVQPISPAGSRNLNGIKLSIEFLLEQF